MSNRNYRKKGRKGQCLAIFSGRKFDVDANGAHHLGRCYTMKRFFRGEGKRTPNILALKIITPG